VKKITLTRIAAATASTMVLAGMATAALADENHGDGNVDIQVEIPENVEPGILALSVGGTSTTLTETGTGELVREFTGTLPTVTVTDTRSAEEIPADAAWYVLGSGTDFVGTDGQDPIGSGHLGWAPRLIDGGAAGLVGEGDPVATVLDPGPNNVGLVDQELLASVWNSGQVASEGQWTATADLFLRTPADVAPGVYTSTLTLSLFE
jgi:hypothetical protein